VLTPSSSELARADVAGEVSWRRTYQPDRLPEAIEVLSHGDLAGAQTGGPRRATGTVACSDSSWRTSRPHPDCLDGTPWARYSAPTQRNSLPFNSRTLFA
jgi:hypothetical protein